MNDNFLTRSGLIILLIYTILLSFAYFNRNSDREPKIIYIQDPNYVQNIGDAQMRLKEQGLYHGKIDYIWGPLMDKAYEDYCAIREIEGK